jgi:hypothetical protein
VDFVRYLGNRHSKTQAAGSGEVAAADADAREGVEGVVAVVPAGAVSNPVIRFLPP